MKAKYTILELFNFLDGYFKENAEQIDFDCSVPEGERETLFEITDEDIINKV
jgi:hypothetical protein